MLYFVVFAPQVPDSQVLPSFSMSSLLDSHVPLTVSETAASRVVAQMCTTLPKDLVAPCKFDLNKAALDAGAASYSLFNIAESNLDAVENDSLDGVENKGGGGGETNPNSFTLVNLLQDPLAHRLRGIGGTLYSNAADRYVALCHACKRIIRLSRRNTFNFKLHLKTCKGEPPDSHASDKEKAACRTSSVTAAQHVLDAVVDIE